MRLRYVKRVKAKNGSEDAISIELSKDELLLGRGANCDLIFESSLVSLEHAKIFLSDGKVVIQDCNSIAGIKVNGKVVTQSILRSSDTVSLANVALQYKEERGNHTLIYSAEETSSSSLDERVQRDVEHLSLPARLPRPALISAMLVITGTLLFFVYPLSKQPHSQQWNSGPISAAHKFIASDCSNCHGAPFERVNDSKCLSCHEMSAHSEFFQASLKGHEGSCSSCHPEHNGEKGITIREDKNCTTCHENITSIDKDSKLSQVKSFDNHPEFTIPTLKSMSNISAARPRLNEKDTKDVAELKFNHSIHLEDKIRGPKGETKLHCHDCHSGKSVMSPITFERDCHSCHTLEFDQRFPGKEVPHGDSDHVHQFLLATYSTLSLSESNELLRKSLPPIRLIPGASTPTEEAITKPIDPVANSLEAERTIFTRTGCKLCHTITERPAASSEMSQFEVAPPKIPERWFPGAKFSHIGHEFMSCKSCHGDVENSKLTSDLLLPSVASCKQCHASQCSKSCGSLGKAPGNCLLCHTFHEQLPIPDSSRRKRDFIYHR